MARHAGDLALHAPPPEQFLDVALDHDLQHLGEGEEGGSDTDQDQDDGEGLPAGREGLHFAEPDGGHRGDGLIESVEPGKAQGDVADRPGHDDADQGRQAEPQPSPRLHERTIATDRRGTSMRRSFSREDA
jgi:hypothetical protein